jgi:hypothetical protein
MIEPNFVVMEKLLFAVAGIKGFSWHRNVVVFQ